mmetsp:Transcript_2156/g.3106  ORF Transcript_2156/g.3106 Transcript_2156/m.3106 type:complete len:102 (-) Transcript_2156:660-965(-)
MIQSNKSKLLSSTLCRLTEKSLTKQKKLTLHFKHGARIQSDELIVYLDPEDDQTGELRDQRFLIPFPSETYEALLEDYDCLDRTQLKERSTHHLWRPQPLV